MEENQEVVTQAEETKKPKKKLGAGFKSFWVDFKAFMSKGNVLNLAVAFVMGAAFTKIVNSLVNDLIMPLFAALFGDTDLANLNWKISDELVINWGLFVLAVVEFLVIAFFLFILIRTITKASSSMNSFSKKTLKALKKGKITHEQATAITAITEEAKAPVDTTESLLKEIRDLLRAGKQVDEPKEQ